MAIDPAFRAEVNEKLDAYRHRLAEAILADAKSRCPKKTGRLAESLKAEVTDDGRVLVGTEVEYALDVEFGTAPHIIRVRRARSLVSDEGVFFGPVVHHPGTKAQPFLAPALNTHRGSL